MGRKKKDQNGSSAATLLDEPLEGGPVEVTAKELDEGKRSQILEDHQALAATLNTMKSKRDFFASPAGAEVKGKILAEYDHQIKQMIAEMETIEKKDLEKAQGRVAGIRYCRSVILGLAWDGDADELTEVRYE